MEASPPVSATLAQSDSTTKSGYVTRSMIYIDLHTTLNHGSDQLDTYLLRLYRSYIHTKITKYHHEKSHILVLSIKLDEY